MLILEANAFSNIVSVPLVSPQAAQLSAFLTCSRPLCYAVLCRPHLLLLPRSGLPLVQNLRPAVLISRIHRPKPRGSFVHVIRRSTELHLENPKPPVRRATQGWPKVHVRPAPS
jgi:hypothetical protein